MQGPAVTDEQPIRRLSLQEWIALDEDASGEWVDGWLVEEEVSSFLHDAIVIWLGVQLGNWLFPRGGTVAGSSTRVVLHEIRGRKPDLIAFFRGRRPSFSEAAVRIPPDIAIEVVSPSARDQRRDRLTKFTEYAAFGIRFYWLVDPAARTLEIYELTLDGRYARALGASEGIVEVPGCKGLRLDLSALWAHVDSERPTGRIDEDR